MKIHKASFLGHIENINKILKNHPNAINHVLEIKALDKVYRITPIFLAAINGQV